MSRLVSSATSSDGYSDDDAWAKRTAFLSSRLAADFVAGNPKQHGHPTTSSRSSRANGGDGSGGHGSSPTRVTFDEDVDDSHVQIPEEDDEDTYSDVYARVASGTIGVV